MPVDLAALRLLAPPSGDGSVTLRTALFLQLLDEVERLRAILDGIDEDLAAPD
jgi:hypothetical protein